MTTDDRAFTPFLRFPNTQQPSPPPNAILMRLPRLLRLEDICANVMVVENSAPPLPALSGPSNSSRESSLVAKGAPPPRAALFLLCSLEM